MCNPVAQVDCLKNSDCDFIVAFGHGTGHDALAGKYSSIPFTHLGAKDRVLSHNQIVALTNPFNQYYKKLTRDKPLEIIYIKGHYRSI